MEGYASGVRGGKKERTKEGGLTNVPCFAFKLASMHQGGRRAMAEE